MEREDLIIFGCGGHSRSVVDVLLSYKPNSSLIFIDEGAKEGELLYGFPVVKTVDLAEMPYFFGIGNNEKRQKKFEEIGAYRLISIVSPKAFLGWKAHVKPGCFVGNFAHIGPEALIGENTILNNGCVVEHEVEIGKHCHIGPRTVISGRCKIGDRVFVGVGAVVKDYINICSDVIIGAGAVVVKDITIPGTYVGCPAKQLVQS